MGISRLILDAIIRRIWKLLRAAQANFCISISRKTVIEDPDVGPFEFGSSSSKGNQPRNLAIDAIADRIDEMVGATS